MRKILLIDGNSMLFRAYYGTQSRGLMRSSSGVATNAVFGFSTMLNRALELFEPTHVLIAFDTGDKTFRHDMFTEYKGTRKEVDEALVSQFALVREFLDAIPIRRYELSGYEADDIIGSIANMYRDDEIDVLTSDRDLLQIVDNHVDVLLMKKGLTDIARMNPKVLKEEMGLRPSQIVDLKALMGDASDNIPGVPRVGEKTAMKLLDAYDTLDAVYENADEIKGKVGESIREHKELAYLSYHLATIKKDIDLNIDIDDYKLEPDIASTNAFYRKYDMNSLIKEVDVVVEERDVVFSNLDESWVGNDVSMYLELDKNQNLVGAYLSDGVRSSYLLSMEMIQNSHFKNLIQRSRVYVSEAKPLYRFCLENDIDLPQRDFEDVLVLSFIVNGSLNTFDKLKDEFNLWYHDLDTTTQGARIASKLFDVFQKQFKSAKETDTLRVYETLERPLTRVLAKCEVTGFKVNQRTLHEIAEETHRHISFYSQEIYKYAGTEFNINSPKQLSEVLFDTLELPPNKKRSTAVDVLEALYDKHPIIPNLLQYRKYQKLYSTYAVGLQKHIYEDGRIHTRLNQHATQTGRLSSSDPNLQNISVRDEETRKIRSAFVPSDGNVLLSIDYSQIELRVLSFLAQETKMMDDFNHQRDIHEETARDIFNIETVNNAQRREAKSVNFGIIYGMSDYGLSQQLDISVSSASSYIKRYHEVYPNISAYMDKTIAMCESEGYVETYFGRRRYIPEIYDKNRAVKEFGKRAAMNAPIQGTAADIIKLAMIKVDAYLSDFKSKMLLQVHDELVFDVYPEELDIIQPQIIEIMETVVDWPIRLSVSATVGTTWMDS